MYRCEMVKVKDCLLLFCFVTLMCAESDIKDNSDTGLTTPDVPPRNDSTQNVVPAHITTPGSQEWYRGSYPNPQIDIQRCGRGKASFVCDPNHILTPHQADQLDELIQGVCESRCDCHHCTLPCSGYSIAIALVPSMKLTPGVERSRHELQLEVERWATLLRKYRWNFGNCDDDMVIVLAMKDRKVYTSTGKQTRKLIPDGCVDRIYKNSRSFLGIGRTYEGLESMIKQYRKALESGGCGAKPAYGQLVGIPVGCGFGILLLGAVCCCCRKKSCTCDSNKTSKRKQTEMQYTAPVSARPPRYTPVTTTATTTSINESKSVYSSSKPIYITSSSRPASSGRSYRSSGYRSSRSGGGGGGGYSCTSSSCGGGGGGSDGGGGGGGDF